VSKDLGPRTSGLGQQTWRPPTRRTFVAMLATAAIALRAKVKPEPEPPPLPRWIGHV
jgi:hypothetical protein